MKTRHKSPAIRLVEARDPKGRDIRDILRDAYAEHRRLVPASEQLGIDPSQFSRWIRRFGGRILGDEVVFPAAADANGHAEPERAEVAAR